MIGIAKLKIKYLPNTNNI